MGGTSAAGIDQQRRRGEMDSECVRIAYGHLPNIALAPMVTSLMVALISRGVLADGRLWGWVGGVWLCSLARLGLAVRFRARPRASSELGPWWWALMIAMGVSGAWFGVLLLLPDGHPPLFLVAIMSLAIGGHIAGGAQSLVATPAILLVCSGLVVIPLWIVIASASDPGIRYLGLMVATFLLSVVFIGRQNYRALREALALRYQNLELAERLAVQNRAETEARAAAESAGRDKTRFLAAASHDLRQPLHALALFVDALKTQAQTERGSHLIGRVETSVDTLQRLLDGLLDISKLDAGGVSPKPRPLATAALARQIETLFAGSARERDLGLRVPASDLAVHTDPDMVGQLLRNLVANAIRYTQRGGVLLAFRRRGQHVRVQVWDTGIGIAEADQGAIFREFHQIGNPERDRSKGVGLGLAIVDRLARLLGTRVEVRSRLGKGTVFWFDLPVAAIKPPPSLVPDDAPSSSLPGTVLLVDDDVLAREGLTAALESWGYAVIAVADASAAGAWAARRLAVDLVVTDFRLPAGETAVDVLRLVHQQLGRQLPAVIVTGETDPAQLRAAQGTGHTVLRKPVKPAELRATLERLRS